MEKTTDLHSLFLLPDIVSNFTILDFIVCFIFFTIMHWIENKLENRSLFLPSFLLKFLVSYLLEKVCPIYITLIVSYIYISVCKSILPNILKIVFPLITKNRGKIVCCSILACLLITSSFPKNIFSLVDRTYFGFFIAQSDSSLCPVENLQENSMNVTRDDLKTVMQELCQFTEEGKETGDYMLDSQEFFALFEDKEPSLDEIREAFSIFDQDRDGFFHARDLHRVLINLGLQGGTNLNTCQHMIELYDRDGDGKINSSDFCRLLEISLL